MSVAKIHQWLVVLATALLAGATVGCGGDDGLNRVEVFGTVILGGRPAEIGQIRFIPQAGTPGPVTIQPIERGAYRCNHHGGVPAGNHRVEILVWDPTVPPPRGPGEAPRPQWAPAKYNRESTLIAIVDASQNPFECNFNL